MLSFKLEVDCFPGSYYFRFGPRACHLWRLTDGNWSFCCD